MKRTFFVMVVLLFVTACSTTQPAPTSTPLPTIPPPPIEARFDGERCIFYERIALPIGELSVLVIDDSGWSPEFSGRRYLD